MAVVVELGDGDGEDGGCSVCGMRPMRGGGEWGKPEREGHCVFG